MDVTRDWPQGEELGFSILAGESGGGDRSGKGGRGRGAEGEGTWAREQH